MPFRIKLTLMFFAMLALVAIALPLILPVPELETTPVAQLAGDEGAFVTVDGLEVFYEEAGSGLEGAPLVLLHGFNLSTYTWRAVLTPLGAVRRTLAFDRPAFGLTERPLLDDLPEGARNPYTPEAQAAVVTDFMDALSVERAVLIGSSSGGGVAVQVALAHPERVAGLVLVGASTYGEAGVPGFLRPLLGTPQAARIGPLAMRQAAEEPGLQFLRRAYADPEALTDEVIQGHRRGLQADNWDAALWEFVRAGPTPNLAARLAEVQVPTLVVSGAEDAVVPPEQSERLAQELPNAEFTLLEGCGHLPQEECPEAFAETVTAWLESRGQ